MRFQYEMLETTFLADGRQWIHGDGPTLADVDAIYPIQWIIRDPLFTDGGIEEFINKEKFPKTIAWIDRFLDAVEKAETAAPKPPIREFF